MPKNSKNHVTNRNETFSEKAETKIWLEKPSKDNPYVAEAVYCHGYELTELMEKCSFIDTLYLLFRGELPTPEESALLEGLMIGLINPGPRHPATRAAMYAGISKAENSHILPISLSIIGGEHLGASEVEPAMRFLRKNKKNSPQDIAINLLENSQIPDEQDFHITPGFGNRYGEIDILTTKIANKLMHLPGQHPILNWGSKFSEHLNSRNLGWLPTGLAAAVLTDLGFQPRAAAGLFQLFNAPGLLAHGAELSNKPVTSMPFPKDENYIIEYEK